MSKEYFDNILDLMQFKSQTFGNAIALSKPDSSGWKEYSYIELSDRTNRFSDFLREQGTARGDKVAIWGESCPEWVIAFLGAIRAGAIVVPLDARATKTEIDLILGDCRPDILIASDALAQTEFQQNLTIYSLSGIENLHPSNTLEGVDRTMEETAFIVYTSGTTGAPKGVKISFGNIVFQVSIITEKIGIGQQDLFLSILPMNHLLELTGGLFSVLYTGGEICYPGRLYPQDILEVMKEKPVTRMVTVPLFLKVLKSYMEKTGVELPHLFRGFICGGSQLDPEVLQFFTERNIPVYEGYGMTETSPVISVNAPDAIRVGSVGKPVQGIEVKISEDGEILTRGPHVMQGYYNQEEWTRSIIDEKGWLHTGDIGRLDEDGYLYVTGRIKNAIVLADGRKVQPEEIETLLEKSSFWKEVCVSSCVSNRNILRGTEEVCVVVVEPKENEEMIKREIEKLTRQLPAYKRPARILFRQEDLPRSASKKVKRHLVREWIDQTTI